MQAALAQASGPVEPGETLTWLRFWVIQNVSAPKRVAAAGGNAQNANFQGTWQAPANMWTPQPFTRGKAALGIAFALAVNQQTNDERIAWWADTINLT